MREAPKVDCPYCHQPATFHANSAAIFGRDYGPVFVCTPCNARASANKYTFEPCGTLANAPLRQARQNLATWFKGLSQSGGMTPAQARDWIAGELGIAPQACRVGLFDMATCVRATELVIARRMQQRAGSD